MAAPSSKLMLFVAAMDSLILLAILLLLSYHSYWYMGLGEVASSLLSHLPGTLLPLLFLAGWRGTADARRAVAGRVAPTRTLLEGFAVGFALVVLANIVALWGGAPYEWGFFSRFLATSWHLQTWADEVEMVVGLSLVAGMVGAVAGFGVSVANRILLIWLRAV